MDTFTGCEPRVGEIRALRTFRIGSGGVLYPLFGTEAWTTATNTAVCAVQATANPEYAQHTAPDPGCGCGFYGFADDSGAAEYPQAQHVLAVIACWGSVVAGTLGVRAQHARVEALWMSPTVPQELRSAVADHYPATSMYDIKAAMLSDHPPTLLDCYEIATPRRRWVRRRALQVVLFTALAVGLPPVSWTWHHHDARLVWVAELGFFLLGAAFHLLTGGDRGLRGTALLYATVILWLIAPLAGGAGFVFLRLPILEIAILGYLHRARLNREASRFPATITAT